MIFSKQPFSPKYINSNCSKQSFHKKLLQQLNIENNIFLPEIKNAITSNKIIHFNILDNKKQISPLNKANSNSNINENQLKLINNFEKFHNIYQSHDNIKKHSFSVINILKKENDIFDKDYQNFLKLKEKKENNKEKFNYLKKIYKKMNYKIPDLSLNHNIFNNNILLIKKNPELKKKVEYGCINNESIKKGINFMDKLNDDIDDLKVNNISNLNFSDENIENKKNTEKKIIKKINPLKEIKIYKNEIKKSKKTFSSLDDLDSFFGDKSEKKFIFDSRNKIKSLIMKKENSSSSFKYSTRVNSPLNYQKEKNKEKNFNKNNLNKENKIISNSNKNINEKFLYKKLPSLEKLYSNIKKSNDKLNFNFKIKNYFKRKNIVIKNDISTKFLCNYLNSSSKILFKKDFLTQNLEIRKKNNNSQKLLLTNRQLQLLEQEKNIKDIMKESEYKLINIYCNDLKK